MLKFHYVCTVIYNNYIATIISRCNTPNTIKIHDIFTSLDLAFFITSGFYVDWLSIVDKEHLSA